VEDWGRLLRYTEGNPLTLTVVVGQALRDGLATKAQIGEYVRKLRAGEARIEDDASQGRTRSLGASLSYGFAAAFSEEERRILALLHLFQGFVNVNALRQMGQLKTITGEDYSLPELRGLTRESGIRLLDRAAGIGLLAPYEGGYYAIHPALPWYFKTLFDEYYPHPSPSLCEGEGSGEGVRATRAYVAAVGELGRYYTIQYEGGNRDVIAALRAEEANLLHARTLARRHGWWLAVVQTMSGLSELYDHTGRRAEWARLVPEIVPDFVDPGTDGPLPGREEEWSLVTEYRMRLAREARRACSAPASNGSAGMPRPPWPRSTATSRRTDWTAHSATRSGRWRRRWVSCRTSSWSRANLIWCRCRKSQYRYIMPSVIAPPKPSAPSTSATRTRTCPPCATWTRPSAGTGAAWSCLLRATGWGEASATMHWAPWPTSASKTPRRRSGPRPSCCAT
jgi:hypothetical protein